MKYIFNEFQSGQYEFDPIFKDKEFVTCGNPGSREQKAIWFKVDKYSYILVDPKNVLDDSVLAFHIACYLSHNAPEISDIPTTYIIGDPSIAEEIGSELSNQVVRVVTYGEIENWFPKNIERIEQLIIRFLLKKQDHYGKIFKYDIFDNYLLCIPSYLPEQSQRESQDFICKCLLDDGLIEKRRYGDDLFEFIITREALERYQDSEGEKPNRKAFIALKFGPKNLQRIAIIKEIISSCGYDPICMDEYQTNDWIMPEIFYQIRVCDFMVADFSLPCEGAYYEAGYAQALGKPVIHTFDKREEKDGVSLHFDIQQKSTVMYDSFDELKERLKKRIEATIGIVR